jgi:hypothetical protein
MGRSSRRRPTELSTTAVRQSDVRTVSILPIVLLGADFGINTTDEYKILFASAFSSQYVNPALDLSLLMMQAQTIFCKPIKIKIHDLSKRYEGQVRNFLLSTTQALS